IFTSVATTAKPRPASPARAASMVAFSARRIDAIGDCLNRRGNTTHRSHFSSPDTISGGNTQRQVAVRVEKSRKTSFRGLRLSIRKQCLKTIYDCAIRTCSLESRSLWDLFQMKMIIFDVDETLCDSRSLILEAQRRVFILNGLTPPPGDSGLAVIGLSLKLVLAELAGPDAPLDQMVSDYHALVPRLREDARFAETPFAGADALLRELSAKPGIALGIATGHRLEGVQPLIDRFGWRSLFST
ncbi:hypothetical protein KXX06_005686, partial [Aspergillus fumigatus]